MNGQYITTPFGRRAVSLGMLAHQMQARDIDPERRVEKWKLFRALCEARQHFGVSDRALAVLNALLSFYPKTEISEENGLVVFPSNAQLSVRAHGIAPATLRRHLAALVDAGLLIRKDSPNGKRYARKGDTGQVEQAFGFSLAPLLVRADEIEAIAAQVVADRQALRSMREQVSLCRRDIAKLIEAAMEEELPGDWDGLFFRFREIVERLPRVPGLADLAPVLKDLDSLRAEIINRMETLVKSKKLSANESQTEHHIQNSNPNYLTELELALKTKHGEGRRVHPAEDRGGMKAFPLAMVLQACPDIDAYGPGGTVGSWRDLMAAAVTVRSMLGVSPGAYQEACETMGPENAATVIACILERAGQINSAGGYLRDLTRRAEQGEFSLGPMLMALIRTNAGRAQKTA